MTEWSHTGKTRAVRVHAGKGSRKIKSVSYAGKPLKESWWSRTIGRLFGRRVFTGDTRDD